jgi:predicted dehydrogenase
MKPVKIGLVGTGGISHAHMLGYSKLAEEGKVELVAACDLNVPRAEAWAKKYGFREVYGNHREMLEKSDLDAVSVCTWNNGHAPITIDALRAGKHVLCEKPPAMTVQEAEAMQKAERESGKTLMIGFVRRFGRNAELVLDFYKSGFFAAFGTHIKGRPLLRSGRPLPYFYPSFPAYMAMILFCS